MKKNRFITIASFMLCGLLSVPVYAAVPKIPARKGFLVQCLDKADRATKIAWYATVALAGLAASVGGGVLAGKSVKKYYKKYYKKKKLNEDKDGETIGGIFAGAILGTAGLSILGYGIRGIKKVLEGREVQKPVQTEAVDTVINGGKKFAGYSLRLMLHSMLTLVGFAAAATGVVYAGHSLYDSCGQSTDPDNGFWVKIKEQGEVIGSAGAGIGLGVTSLIFGIKGLMQTYRDARNEVMASKETSAKAEAATQTDEPASEVDTAVDTATDEMVLAQNQEEMSNKSEEGNETTKINS